MNAPTPASGGAPPEREWYMDTSGCWCFRVGEAWVYLDRRPPYCDRGRWRGHVGAGVIGLDVADAFPRYFMDLDRARAELAEWLAWRVECDRRA